MLHTGEIVNGKWNKNRYIILKKLGQGGIGQVYKVKDKYGEVKALKISEDINSITREYENMKRFKTIRAVPKVYEVDDYSKYGKSFHFFTLDYIEGYNLRQIIKLKDISFKDIIKIAIIISKNLRLIYDFGYSYNDLKLENIMIDKKSKDIYLIDFGGAVSSDLGLKEYTPTYNMISWGSKYANNPIKNMIFAVNMLVISMILKEEPSPMLKNLSDIKKDIEDIQMDKYLKKTIISSLNGSYNDMDLYIKNLKSIDLNKSSGIDIINLIFKGSIFSFFIVVTISMIINWM